MSTNYMRTENLLMESSDNAIFHEHGPVGVGIHPRTIAQPLYTQASLVIQISVETHSFRRPYAADTEDFQAVSNKLGMTDQH